MDSRHSGALVRRAQEAQVSCELVLGKGSESWGGRLGGADGVQTMSMDAMRMEMPCVAKWLSKLTLHVAAPF